MDKLPPDILRKIVMNFRPYDLLEFCLVSSTMNKSVCNSHDFWVEKLRVDFPLVIEFLTRNNLRLNDPKNTYYRYYLKLTLGIENIVNTYVDKISNRDNSNESFVTDSKNFINTFPGNINKLLLDAYLDLIELVYILQTDNNYEYNNYKYNDYRYRKYIDNIFDFYDDLLVLNPIILDYIYTIIEKYNGTEEWVYPLYYLIFTVFTKIEIPYIRIKLKNK